MRLTGKVRIIYNELIPKGVLFVNLSKGRKVGLDAAQRRIEGLVLRRLGVNLGF